ncbi:MULTISPECIES: ATP-binding protein [unclassified Amycolatopsis]|uniref:ATP-binding protein n=1 Tax=unclassified Amycolatopsis TaxID=2618356 RepID=UPI002E24A726|nr:MULTISPECIES: ATP-binding protein [unclassified Amycolatopsis]
MRESFDFDVDPKEIRLVRSWARERLVAAGDLPADTITDIVLIMNELATNAVRHATGPARVRLLRSDSTVWIGVEDAGGAAWFDPAVPLSTPIGTGLTLVAACSRRRGHFHRGDGGRTVWAEIPVAS